MKYFVGLDVALRSLALCIIDGEGQIVLEQALLCEVDEIRSCLEEFGHPIVRIGFEAGTMSQTLFHGLKAAGYDVVFNDLIQAAASHGDVSVQVTDANGQTQTVTIGEVVGALLGANVTIETANLNNGSLGGLTTFSGTDSTLVQINTNNTGLSDTLENLLHEGLHVLSNIGDGPDDGPAGNEAAWVATAAQELRNAVLQATAATETKDDDFDTTPQDGCET